MHTHAHISERRFRHCTHKARVCVRWLLNCMVTRVVLLSLGRPSALPSSGEGSHGLGYIMLRRTARSGRNAGRTYAACPLGKPGDQHAGAAGSVAAAAGCNRWRWDV